MSVHEQTQFHLLSDHICFKIYTDGLVVTVAIPPTHLHARAADPVLKIRSNPDPGFKISSDPDHVFEFCSDPDTVCSPNQPSKIELFFQYLVTKVIIRYQNVNYIDCYVERKRPML